jgi:hypothetical protein
VEERYAENVVVASIILMNTRARSRRGRLLSAARGNHAWVRWQSRLDNGGRLNLDDFEGSLSKSAAVSRHAAVHFQYASVIRALHPGRRFTIMRPARSSWATAR